MKVRFYADVPPMTGPSYIFCASTKPGAFTMPPNWKRVAFDVDFPPDVMSEFDAKAPAQFVGVVDGDTQRPEA